MQFIADIGSGNTLTDADTAIKLIDEVIKRDTGKHEVIFKTQLFREAPPNKPLLQYVFAGAWSHAKSNGYHLTSSVFDQWSLDFLLEWDTKAWPLPFIKIACRPDLYWLIGEIPRRIPVYCSTSGNILNYDVDTMYCVREYPANVHSYDYAWELGCAFISDHTEGLGMFKEHYTDTMAWEKHVCLEHTPDNPDAGAFAVLPEELEEIL